MSILLLVSAFNSGKLSVKILDHGPQANVVNIQRTQAEVAENAVRIGTRPSDH